MKKILIIEDDVVVSSIYRRKYELAGFDVENALDGVAGLAKVYEYKPDIVQLDLQLPKMNGIDVIKDIRSRPEFKNLPILVLSSFYKHDMVKEAWKAGATKCVTKIECTPVLAIEIVNQMVREAEGPSGGGNQAPGAGGGGYAPAQFPPQSGMPGGFPAGYPMQPGGYPGQVQPGAYIPAQYAGQPQPAPFPGQQPGGYAMPPSQVQPGNYAPYPVPGGESRPDQAAGHGGEFQGQSPHSTPPSFDIRQEFLSRIPEIQANLRERVNTLIRAKGMAAQLPLVREFHEACHSVANLAGTTGFVRVSNLAEALEYLLKELHGKPARITQSSLRTIAHAADVLIALCQEAQDPMEGTPQSGLILAVDDEPISRRVLANALSKANLKTISLDDPQLALRVMQENQFDLIFLDADMPVMNGFELCKQLRALPTNKTTPVVFVTSLNDFESRAQSSLAGGNDLIAKPFLMIELAVKALTYLMKPRLKKPATPAGGQPAATGATPSKPAAPTSAPEDPKTPPAS